VERSGFRPQGYLVLREIAGATLLGPFLAERRAGMTVRHRRELAAHLGREVARLHDAGIDHPDLFSKHILLIAGASGNVPQVSFIDMQRSCTRSAVSRAQRVYDLASLDATVPAHLASRSDRLAFLQSYLRGSSPPLPSAQMVSAICRRSRKLQSRRKIRAMREGVGSLFHAAIRSTGS
jgi:tRNA A-37 threonylcarbamoyl transferase component Bud32